jgi:hypothetical protein
LIVSVSIAHRDLDQRLRWAACAVFFGIISLGRLDAARCMRAGHTVFGLAITGFFVDPWAPSTSWNAKSRTFATNCSVARRGRTRTSTRLQYRRSSRTTRAIVHIMRVVQSQILRAVALAIIAMAAPVAALIGMGSPKAEAQAPTITNDGSSINTYNHSGGNSAIDVGPTHLQWDPAIGEHLVEMLPPGKTIALISLGPASDQKVVDAYQLYLESRGFIVRRTSLIGMMSPMPDHQITLGNRNAPKMEVIIAPSADIRFRVTK